MTQQKKVAPFLWGAGIIVLILIFIFWKSVGPKFFGNQQTETEVTVLPAETAPKITLAKSTVAGVGGSGKGFTTLAFPGAEEGVVYSDDDGNTYERHTGGWRTCEFAINGKILERVFVGDLSKPHDKLATKKECDILAKKFYAAHKSVTVKTR